MTDSTYNKIKTLIENSKSFAVLLDEHPEEHEFLAKELLKEAVIEKNIPLVSLPKDSQAFQEKWSNILKETTDIDLPQKTSIKIPKEKYQIKEVAYKEDHDNLSFVITSPQNDLVLEDLSVEKLPPEAETVFCLFEDETRLEKFQDQIYLPKRDKTVFIKADGKTLTGKIFDILKIFNPEIHNDKNKNTLLLATLLTETNNFSEKITTEAFSLANLFIENGAEIKTVSKIIEKAKNPFTAQLMGRILARTYTDESLGISWSFLNNRDLQKTNNVSVSIGSLYQLLKKVRIFIPAQNLYILMWQTIEGVKTLVTAGEDKSRLYLTPFAEKAQAQLQSRFFIVGPFESFSAAERQLREHFKEEINNICNSYVEER